MRVVVFAVADRTVALKLDRIEKILSPDEAPPAGREVVDLAARLGLAPGDGREAPHRVLLAGSDALLALGRPLGTARLEPSWILPLPGYMFIGGVPPFRGLIDLSGRNVDEASRRLLHLTLLLDEERIGGGH